MWMWVSECLCVCMRPNATSNLTEIKWKVFAIEHITWPHNEDLVYANLSLTHTFSIIPNANISHIHLFNLLSDSIVNIPRSLNRTSAVSLSIYRISLIEAETSVLLSVSIPFTVCPSISVKLSTQPSPLNETHWLVRLNLCLTEYARSNIYNTIPNWPQCLH